MTEFSGTRRRPLGANVTAPERTTGRGTFTHEGGLASVRDAESELFLLPATNMVGVLPLTSRDSIRDLSDRI